MTDLWTICGAILLGSCMVAGAILAFGLIRARTEASKLAVVEREQMRVRIRRMECEAWRGLNSDIEQKLDEANIRIFVLDRENKRLLKLLEAAERKNK